jgi:hypothetical protein
MSFREFTAIALILFTGPAFADLCYNGREGRHAYDAFGREIKCIPYAPFALQPQPLPHTASDLEMIDRMAKFVSREEAVEALNGFKENAKRGSVSTEAMVEAFIILNRSATHADIVQGHQMQVGLFQWKTYDGGKVYASFVIRNGSNYDLRDVMLSCVSKSSLINTSMRIRQKTDGSVMRHSIRQFSNIEIHNAFPNGALSCEVEEFEFM